MAFDNARAVHDSRRLVAQLGTAPHTRQTIGQAEGLLMRHLGCDRREGFALVDAHEQGDRPAALTRFDVPDERPVYSGRWSGPR
ncbi:ANTAR domain-containing protein [Qaidamihabitans albus]|uniref:ANTAR domain-containing protein n=1 Tax=Qaidamihabitans albus TaxID=2795733 RepID=UPI001F1AC630|nr:ANTAR domain-containing protein [Qaidamihabitans albus]